MEKRATAKKGLEMGNLTVRQEHMFLETIGNPWLCGLCVLKPCDTAATVIFEKVLLWGSLNKDEVPRFVFIAL